MQKVCLVTGGGRGIGDFWCAARGCHCIIPGSIIIGKQGGLDALHHIHINLCSRFGEGLAFVVTLKIGFDLLKGIASDCHLAGLAEHLHPLCEIY